MASRDELELASPQQRSEILRAWATQVRRSVVKMIESAQMGHIGGDFSVADILTVAYLTVLNVDPADPRAGVRDRFILSKGHASASLYSMLALTGYFNPEALSTFMAPMSPLNGHPNRNKIPGVETNTGPLGHGLPVGVGIAIAARLKGDGTRVMVVTGDGELQEGSNWEALMAASQYRLHNLTVVIDRNRLQQGASTEDTNRLDPLDAKLAAFGWEVREIDGHNYAELETAFSVGRDGRPVAVIANTVKGRGVSFIENRVEWHHKVPSHDQVAKALGELV
jgi:transketolase